MVNNQSEIEFEKIYIGRSTLMEEKSFDMWIYDWRSPIASVFYRFVMGQSPYITKIGKIAENV